MREIKNKIIEDTTSVVPANSVGNGGVEGIGFGPKGEPGKKPLRAIVKRNMPIKFTKDN